MKAKTKYFCTDCGKDAYLAMTQWQAKDGKKLFKKGERLCPACSFKRTGIDFFGNFSNPSKART
jgi:DNA-directed RNA polymerase subunit RPC12/RpoP